MTGTAKRLLTTFTTAALALSLTACGATSGTVLAKEYDDADRRTRICHTTINGRTTAHTCIKRERERWRLELNDGEATGWRNVSREAYEACRVGDYYDAEQKACRA
jgi:YD repeat-containing protein